MAYFLTFLPLYARTIGLDGAGIKILNPGDAMHAGCYSLRR